MNARIRRIPAAARSAVARFRSTPLAVRSRFLWGIRRGVLPYIRIPIRVRSSAGTRIHLGADPVDDQILEETLTTYASLYFPEGAFKRDDAFLALDVGAHHGIPAVEMLVRYPAARMVAVEPNPLSVEFLRRNCSLNNLLGRVTIVEAGIGKADTDGLLIPGARSWGDSTLSAESKLQVPPGSIGVKLLTLESVLRGQKPAFVKCNAEGAEFELIPQLLALGIRPRIIVLLVHQECGDVDKLLSSIGEAGYAVAHVHSGRNRPRLLCRLKE